MYNILICDDERDIVNALKIYLANPDYRLLEAHTGQETLDILDREDIHLVLLDIMMPGDGRHHRPVEAPGAEQRAGDPADRQERGHGQDPGAERGGGRLRHQALQPRGGGCPGPQPAAAVLPAGGRDRPAGGADPGRHPAGRPGEGRHRGRGRRVPDPYGVRHSEAADGAPGPGVFPPGRSTGGCGGTLPSAARTRWRSTSATCGRRSRSTRRSPGT